MIKDGVSSDKQRWARSCWWLLPAAAMQAGRDLSRWNPFHVDFIPKVISEVARSWGEKEGHIVKYPPWIKVETIPLPRKVGGRAVKIWTCISLLCYVSQERKSSFFKTQRIYFLSPLSGSHSVTVNQQQKWAVLCLFSASNSQPKLSLVVKILFTTMIITQTWKKWSHGVVSELLACQTFFSAKVLCMYIYSFTSLSTESIAMLSSYRRYSIES